MPNRGGKSGNDFDLICLLGVAEAATTAAWEIYACQGDSTDTYVRT